MLDKTVFVNAVTALMDANQSGKVVKARQDAFIRVLEEATGCQKGLDGKTWIQWWIYDNNFGQNKLTIRFNNTDEQIETPEELYDLIVFRKGIR